MPDKRTGRAVSPDDLISPAWLYGLGPDDGPLYCCALSTACQQVGTAGEMERHQLADHPRLTSRMVWLPRRPPASL